jgi:glycosyltransferase involved in cell wall biosynthesis
MQRIMIVHPEGNLTNNPNLTGIVEILCSKGYEVDIYSPRLGHLVQEAPCPGAKFVFAPGDPGALSGVIGVLPPGIFANNADLHKYIAHKIPRYDLIIGVDRGIIEASLIATQQQVPYGIISYEILFSEETGPEYLQHDIQASRGAAFAVCQDRVRSFHLSKENGIPLERIIDIPVAGRAVKRGTRTHLLHEILGIPASMKIALYIGSVTYQWAGIDELIASSELWNDEWALVLHHRYSTYDPNVMNKIAAKRKKNIYLSPLANLPFNRLHVLLNAVDVGLSFYIPQFNGTDISARNNLKYIGMASGKTATYLQHGLPILINEQGEMSDSAKRFGLGAVVGNFHELHTVLGSLSSEKLEACRKNSYAFFEEVLDLDIRIRPLLDVLETLLPGRVAAGRADGVGQGGNIPLSASLENQADLVQQKTLHALLVRAEQGIESQNTAAAREILRQIVSAFPGNVDALNDLAIVEIMEQRMPAALALLKQILVLQPDNEIARENFSLITQSADRAQPDLLKSTVSAIVSAYNSERFMAGCLTDLVGQTLYAQGRLEIIIVDSGSKENERRIVEQFQTQYQHIRYIRTEERETVYAAWNRGIEAASGTYITNANTDDRHRFDAFEKMAGVLDQHSEAGLVYADVSVTDRENETFEHHTPSGRYSWLEFNRELLTMICYVGPQPMWRKSLHEHYGLFDKTFSTSGDWEFWLRIARGTTFLHIPEYLGLYLRSPASVEHRSAERRAAEDERIRAKYFPGYLPDVEIVDRTLAAVRELERVHPNDTTFPYMRGMLGKYRSDLISK